MARAVGCSGLALVVVGSTTTASAASPLRPEPAPKILAPTAETIVGSKRLRVAVKVPKRPVARFRATLGGRDVTAKFGPPRGRVRRARIGGLEPGRHILAVSLDPRRASARARLGHLADSAVIYVRASRKRKLLTVGRVRLARGRIRVHHRRPFRQASGDERAVGVARARVNGRLARGSLGTWEHAGRTRGFFRISSTFGLRHGRNVVRIDAARESGAFDRRPRVIVLPRNRPIAGAGRDRRAMAGHSVGLDGTDSIAAPRGHGGLRYRWRVVSKPDGSKPRLRGRTTATPRLTTPEPGGYRVALTVRQRVDGRIVTAANRDVVTIATAPVTTAAGLPFQSIDFDAASKNYTVQVGDDLYDYPTQGTPPQVLGYTVMGLDAETLEQTYEFTPAYNVAGPCQPNGDACNQMISDAGGGIPSASQWANIPTYELGPSGLVYWIAAQAQISPQRPQIVVVVGDSVEDWVSQNPNGLSQLQVIGGPPDPLDLPGQDTPFSFVGVTNSTPGTGWWNTTNGSLDAPSTAGTSNFGNLAGNLAPGSAGLFTFVPQDAVPFDTNTTGASSGATTVTASVGDQTITGTCPSSGGMLAAALDPGTAELIASTQFCGDDFLSNGLPAWLGQYTQTATALVLLQSIGGIQTDGQPNAGQAMLPLGGLAAQDAINQVNGGFTYLGAVNSQGQLYWSDQYPGGSTVVGTRLNGLLVRGNNGRLEPQLAQAAPDLVAAGLPPDDSSYLATLQLQQFAYEDPVPWPGDTYEQAAEQYISQQLGFDPVPDPAYGGALTYNVRSYYDSPTHDLTTELAQYTCAAGTLDYGPLSGTQFSVAQCQAALAQLSDENTYVVQIWKLIGAIQNTFELDGTSDSILFTNVADTVNAAVADADATTQYNWQDFAGGGFSVLQALWDLGSEEIEDLVDASPFLGLISAAFYVADQFGTDANGVSLSEVDEDLAQVAADADSMYTSAVDSFTTLAGLVTSDWGKLQQVGQSAVTQQPGFTVPENPSAVTATQNALTTSFKRLLIPGAIAAFADTAVGVPQYGSVGTTFDLQSTPTFGYVGEQFQFICDDIGYGAINLDTFWPQQINQFFITDRGMTPSYVVYLLLEGTTADSQDVPDAVTNGIYDPPDGSVGTLAAGFTPASLFTSGAFTFVPPPYGADQCGIDPALQQLPGSPPFNPPP
jgi:hypothetical protein